MKQCSFCVMNETAQNIKFDTNGRCNYCLEFAQKYTQFTQKNTPAQLNGFVERIKHDGRGKQYDCIVGVSGGVDSSYTLYMAKQLGLRPLAVHLDNGWNSELAVANIANLINGLGVDLYTHVIDWPENRDMQRSFFNAHVVDIELLMDNAMMALNYKMANKFGVKYILAGTNTATEGMSLPPDWNWFKLDKKNIKNIQKKFGTMPIKTHPIMGVWQFVYYEYIRKIKWVHFLNYCDYNKQQALDILQESVNYKPYPYKHYESVFTRFYQGYILPHKFGVDKRLVHLSTLIVSGQMTRTQALEYLATPPYPNREQEAQDKEFVMKKLGFTPQYFDQYIQSPPINHANYGSEKPLYNQLKTIHQTITKGLP